MAHPFRDVNAKIRRAGKHFVDLQVATYEWTKANPIRTVHEHDRKTGWHYVRAEKLPDPPDEWLAILGDVAHNLRSALEYTVEQLIVANQQTPQRTNQFPIISDAKDSHLLRVHLAGVHPRAVEIIEKAQPYQRPYRRDPEPLEILAGLSNIDKHHTGQFAVVMQQAWDRRFVQFMVGQVSKAHEMMALVGPGVPISDARIAGMRLTPVTAIADMEMAHPIPIEIAFGSGALPLRKVSDVISVVRSVIKPLRPFVTDPPVPA